MPPLPDTEIKFKTIKETRGCMCNIHKIKMLKRIKPALRSTFVQLILSSVFVCFFIYIWKFIGCLGFSQCSLCQTFRPGAFVDKIKIDYSRDDFERLMDLNNFTFLMNNLKCNKSDPLLLVLVHSDPFHYEKRLTIRNTWGQIISDNFKVLFLVGVPNEVFSQQRLNYENELYEDLIQGNFMDTYRNLTYKHVMALKWTEYFCHNARYILKTDDDVFINSPGLMNYLKLNVLPRNGLMRCVPVWSPFVKRSYRSKWRVTFAEYEFRTYPSYCQGLGILYTPDVASVLYKKAQKAKYFWVDDVFITGILASAVNIFPSTFGEFILSPEVFYKFLKQYTTDFPYLVGPWNVEEKNIRDLWKKIPKHNNKIS